MVRNINRKYHHQHLPFITDYVHTEEGETGAGPYVFDPGPMMEPKKSFRLCKPHHLYLRDNSSMFKNWKNFTCNYGMRLSIDPCS